MPDRRQCPGPCDSALIAGSRKGCGEGGGGKVSGQRGSTGFSGAARFFRSGCFSRASRSGRVESGMEWTLGSVCSSWWWWGWHSNTSPTSRRSLPTSRRSSPANRRRDAILAEVIGHRVKSGDYQDGGDSQVARDPRWRDGFTGGGRLDSFGQSNYEGFEWAELQVVGGGAAGCVRSLRSVAEGRAPAEALRDSRGSLLERASMGSCGAKRTGDDAVRHSRCTQVRSACQSDDFDSPGALSDFHPVPTRRVGGEGSFTTSTC